MKSSDRTILTIFLMVVLALGFWMFVLSPKRKQANEISAQVTELEQSIADQNAVADYAEQARKDFPKYYGRLVVLGKAVPDSGDSASLLVQLSQVSKDAGVDFNKIEIGSAPAGAPPTTPTTSVAEQANSPSATEAPGGDSTGTATTTATTTSTTTSTVTPATEADAASLPIGASIGPAGLPVLPYNLSFDGDFFSVADFLSGLDDLVEAKSNGQVAADGRLLTVDGFALTADPVRGFPFLQADFAITTYATPSSQGLTLGASPTGPAVAPETTPTSATVTP